MHNERLTLATICGGAVQEKVDRALEQVAWNILDPNTDPGKKRVITLKITCKPNENDNEDVTVTADVSVALVPETGVATQFFVNKDLKNGQITVMEHRKGETVVSWISVTWKAKRKPGSNSRTKGKARSWISGKKHKEAERC